MRPLSNVELLNAWRVGGDREAMDQLIRRHVDFVYAAARRQVGDRHLAEDVAQAVFMLLMTKSPRLRSDGALAVWLHSATRYAAANARRMEARRMWRERRAAELSACEHAVESVDGCGHAELLPLLDEAIGWLPRRDREGVVLCFYHRFSYGQIGAMLGLSEEAARKRISRAIERMRAFFQSRGVTTTVMLISAGLAQESLAVAPASLVQASANLAGVWHLAGGASSSSAILKGVLQTMLITKLKIAAACVAIVLGGAASVTAIQHGAAAQQAADPVAALSDTTFKIDAGHDVTVEFLCVARWPANNDAWFSLDGRKVTIPQNPFENIRFRPDRQPTHQALVRISGSDHPGFQVQVPGASRCLGFDLDGQQPDELYLLIVFTFPDDKNSADLELSLACGEWETLCEADHTEPGRSLGQHQTAKGGVAFTHISDAPVGGGSIVYVAHEIRDQNWSVFCTDEQGKAHGPINVDGGPVGGFNAAVVGFHLLPHEIASLQFRARPFNKKIVAKNVTLDPQHRTTPQVMLLEPARK